MCRFERAPENEPSSSRDKNTLDSEALTRVACMCGCVQLDLSDSAPLAIILDGCRDCSYFNDWLAESRERRGASAPPTSAQSSVPLTNLYYSNHIRVSFGERHLCAFKLTSSSATTRIAATCCGSMVLADHPLYESELVMAPAAACTSNGFQAAHDDCPVHIFSVSPAQRHARPAFVGTPGLEVRGTEPAEVQAHMISRMFGDMLSRATDKPAADDGQRDWGTVQDLVARLCHEHGYVVLDEAPDGRHAVNSVQESGLDATGSCGTVSFFL